LIERPDKNHLIPDAPSAFGLIPPASHNPQRVPPKKIVNPIASPFTTPASRPPPPSPRRTCPRPQSGPRTQPPNAPIRNPKPAIRNRNAPNRGLRPHPPFKPAIRNPQSAIRTPPALPLCILSCDFALCPLIFAILIPSPVPSTASRPQPRVTGHKPRPPSPTNLNTKSKMPNRKSPLTDGCRDIHLGIRPIDDSHPAAPPIRNPHRRPDCSRRSRPERSRRACPERSRTGSRSHPERNTVESNGPHPFPRRREPTPQPLHPSRFTLHAHSPESWVTSPGPCLSPRRRGPRTQSLHPSRPPHHPSQAPAPIPSTASRFTSPVSRPQRRFTPNATASAPQASTSPSYLRMSRHTFRHTPN
jgi:hypothetical protein